ncbi:MAG: VanZ family protein [Bacteroidota bacterium]
MRQLLQKHGFIYDQLPAILWAAIIFVASSIPNLTLPEIEFVATDKAAHALIYFVLCALVYRALKFQNRFSNLGRWSILWCVVFSTLFGASDEFHQSFVPNRVASVLDLAADLLGALLFAVVALVRTRARDGGPRAD